MNAARKRNIGLPLGWRATRWKAASCTAGVRSNEAEQMTRAALRTKAIAQCIDKIANKGD
ncbi:hypothetical protein [Octadecabacter antarcticus]|uniref:hypothetical protein n=1 Tax=Octadecabacter antarcticus TaxID=1217908 RepID=UPI0001806DBF|nr:hypothetical protein [Octadecabacter antarcticus]